MIQIKKSCFCLGRLQVFLLTASVYLWFIVIYTWLGLWQLSLDKGNLFCSVRPCARWHICPSTFLGNVFLSRFFLPGWVGFLCHYLGKVHTYVVSSFYCCALIVLAQFLDVMVGNGTVSEDERLKICWFNRLEDPFTDGDPGAGDFRAFWRDRVRSRNKRYTKPGFGHIPLS